MNFTGVKGNTGIKERLSHTALSHAYLISGPAGSGKTVLASVLARAMVCAGAGERPCNICTHCVKAQRGIHPDIIPLDVERDDKGREKREITVSQVRGITAEIRILPNEAEKKVYVIRRADKMNRSAQNALLKVLEEPPATAVFLLTAENAMLLLPTVRSRCVALKLTAEDDGGRVGTSGLAERFLSLLPDGGLPLTAFCVEMEKLDRQSLADFLEECSLAMLQLLKSGPDMCPAARVIYALELFDTLRRRLEFSAGTGHVFGEIAAKLS